MRRFMMGVAIAAASMMPLGALAGDQETAQAVANNLKTSGRLKGYNIDVKAKDGAVILIGKVASDEQLAAAVDIANRTQGVEKVIVQLTSPQSPATPEGLRQPNSLAGDATAVKGVQPAMPSPRRMTPASTASYESAPKNEPNKVASNSAAPNTLPSQNGVPMRTAMKAQPAPSQSPVPSSVAVNQQQMAAQPQQIRAQSVQQRRPNPQVAMGVPPQFQPVALHGGAPNGEPIPAYAPGMGGTIAPTQYDHPQMPNYAWPSYAAYPNYAALTYPKQYSATAWPFIGPFYPYPQVPLGWRKVTLEWDDGWWFLDFDDRGHHCHR